MATAQVVNIVMANRVIWMKAFKVKVDVAKFLLKKKSLLDKRS